MPFKIAKSYKSFLIVKTLLAYRMLLCILVAVKIDIVAYNKVIKDLHFVFVVIFLGNF